MYLRLDEFVVACVVECSTGVTVSRPVRRLFAGEGPSFAVVRSCCRSFLRCFLQSVRSELSSSEMLTKHVVAN